MLFMYFQNDDDVARDVTLRVIEEGASYELGKGWIVRRDRGHHDPSTYRYHVQLHRQDVSVINGDGTQSHSTNRDQLPNWVIDKMVDQKLIKEGAEPLHLHEIDPTVAEKVRRIEKYGVLFELVVLAQTLKVLARWSGRQ